MVKIHRMGGMVDLQITMATQAVQTYSRARDLSLFAWSWNFQAHDNKLDLGQRVFRLDSLKL